jgi:hypothetical protein
MLCKENRGWSVLICSRRYLNNVVEQDHRAIEQRCAPMLALKSFRTAAVTLAGVELAHRIRKRQFSFGRGGLRCFPSLKHMWALALAREETGPRRRDASPMVFDRSCTRTQVYACRPTEKFSHQTNALSAQAVGSGRTASVGNA